MQNREKKGKRSLEMDVKWWTMKSKQKVDSFLQIGKIFLLFHQN